MVATGKNTQEAILGLDIGTTSTKAVLFDLSGVELAAAEQAYHFHAPQVGWVEQDPEDLWEAVIATLRAIMAAVKPTVRPIALSLAAQSGSLIPARSDGTPLYPAIIWMDGRTEDLVKQWRAEGIEPKVRRISGWQLHPGLCLPTIAWLRQFRPDIFAAAGRFFSVNDFIIYQLTGQFCMNPSNGGGMQLVEVATGVWSDELCALAGIRPGQLSPIRPSGAVIGPLTAEASRLTGLPGETLVINGGHDQGCTALGMGVASPGKMLLACGTSWVVTGVVETPDVDKVPGGMDMNFHPAPQRWTVSQSLGGLGASLEWWLNQGWRGLSSQPATSRPEVYAALESELAQTTPGSDGLCFLPVAGGHQEPAGIQRGGFVGLRLGHSRADMARAIMEGAAFELRWALHRLRQAGMPIEQLWMVGGAARSSTWPAIVADVTGLPLLLTPYNRWPALGAALLAGWGAGLFESLEAGQARFEKTVQPLGPDEIRQPFYEACFARYQQLTQTALFKIIGGW